MIFLPCVRAVFVKTGQKQPHYMKLIIFSHYKLSRIIHSHFISLLPYKRNSPNPSILLSLPTFSCLFSLNWKRIALTSLSLLSLPISFPYYPLSPSNSLAEQVGKILRKFNKIQMENFQNVNTTGKFIVWDAYDSTGLGNRYKIKLSKTSN